MNDTKRSLHLSRETIMKNVLIVGAGRLGKGFIGETFDNAGWNITFLDKDPKVEEELKKQGWLSCKSSSSR